MNVKDQKYIYIVWFLMLALIINTVNMGLKTSEFFLILIYISAIITTVLQHKTWCSLYLFFIVYCFFCNAGQPLLHLFGIEWEGINIYMSYPTEAIIEMICFQMNCILALQIGALLVYKKYNIKDLGGRSNRYVIKFSHPMKSIDLQYYSYIILVSIMHIQYIDKFIHRIDMGYGEFFYSDNATTSASLLLTVAYYVLLFINFINYKDKKNKRYKIIMGSMITLTSLMLMVGSRSLVIPIVCGLLFIANVNKRENKIPFKKKIIYLLGILLGMNILSVIGNLRNLSLASIDLQTIKNIFGFGILYTVTDLIQEMGSTSRCIMVTMSNVGVMGSGKSTMVYAFLKSFLSVSTLEKLGFSGYENSLSMWVTSKGGGTMGTASWGYSVIAEAYYDYGKYGWIALFILGMIWMIIENLINKNIARHRYVVAVTGVYLLSYLVFAARAELLLYSVPARYCFYIVVFAIGARYLLGEKHAERGRK